MRGEHCLVFYRLKTSFKQIFRVAYSDCCWVFIYIFDLIYSGFVHAFFTHKYRILQAVRALLLKSQQQHVEDFVANRDRS